MKMYYITLNNEAVAKKISIAMIEEQAAVCTNWFAIKSAYYWEGKINLDDEIVLIVKTNEGKRQQIESIIARHIDYTNCIAEIPVDSINNQYAVWLESTLKSGSRGT